MPTHHFTLIVDGADLQRESVVDSLFEAGCDDALVGSTDGIQFIDFDREAASFDDAVLSAVADVEQVSGIQVVRMAGAGLVSIADIAARTGRTREACGCSWPAPAAPGAFRHPSRTPEPDTGCGAGAMSNAGSGRRSGRRLRERKSNTCSRPSTPAWNSVNSAVRWMPEDATDCRRWRGSSAKQGCQAHTSWLMDRLGGLVKRVEPCGALQPVAAANRVI